jgi:ribosomal protein L32E
MTVILVATGLAAAGQEPAGFSSLVVTNIAQLRRLTQVRQLIE